MLRADWVRHTLHMKRPSRTSRQVMNEKETFFMRITDTERPGVKGYGEVAMFRGLSADDTPDFEKILEKACSEINDLDLNEVPSSAIRFGLETALSDLANDGSMRPFDKSDDWRIAINGLVWMGSRDFMAQEIESKLRQGFRCIKLKIGGIDFEDELCLLKSIRNRFPAHELELRLDANGAFTPENALARLDRLAPLSIHSLEQPIKAGQPEAMARICKESPIDIALDEELIGLTPDDVKRQRLDFIRPRYVILKPSLCGGFAQADTWIETASRLGIGWWMTSALESDIGLNAIARKVNIYSPKMPQGLGTGQVYADNIPSPLQLVGDCLTTDPSAHWADIDDFFFNK